MVEGSPVLTIIYYMSNCMKAQAINNGNRTGWSAICIGIHTVSSSIWSIFARVSFCTSRFGKWNFSFLINSKAQINSKLDINMKKIVWKKCQKIFLTTLFSPFKITFSKFPNQILVIILRDIIGLHCFSLVLHFLHWCYAWTAQLSANQNRVIFYVYY